MVRAPPSTSTIEITIATMGRLMKNFDMTHLPVAFVVNGFGLTCMPGRTFWVPSTTTRSPGLSPSEITQPLSICAPTVTDRIADFVVLIHYGYLVARLATLKLPVVAQGTRHVGRRRIPALWRNRQVAKCCWDSGIGGDADVFQCSHSLGDRQNKRSQMRIRRAVRQHKLDPQSLLVRLAHLLPWGIVF